MTRMTIRRRPGEIRDAIGDYLESHGESTTKEITDALRERFGFVHPSSVRSSLNHLREDRFERVSRGRYRLRSK